MSAKIGQAERAGPLQLILKPSRGLDGRSAGSDSRAARTGSNVEPLLVPKEAAQLVRLSLSWLAKARMRGDGPPYVKLGRSIRYTEAGLLQWMKSRQRRSTSEI